MNTLSVATYRKKYNSYARSFTLGLGCLLQLFLIGGASTAQSTFEITVSPVFGVVYPAGRWLPLRVELRNSTDSAVNGAVRIPVSLPSASSDIRIPAVVPPRSKVVLMSFGYLPDKPLPQVNAPAGTGAVPVAIAEWIAADGARLARSDVLGQPDTADKSATTGQSQTSGSLLLSVNRKEFTESRDAYRLQRLTELLAGVVTYPLHSGECEPSILPRHVAGYEAVRAVVLNGVSPDSLDGAQRQAITSYLLQGGIVVLPAPLGDADPTGTWLEPLLPVRIIGHREAGSVGALPGISKSDGVAEAPALKLRETLELCEAIDGDGEVVLSDAHYVHASLKSVGLGRVIFTSFPIDALDHADARTVAIWRQLLNLDSGTIGWGNSALGSERDSILQTMIGAPVPPWSRAALIACGYVLLMLVIQMILPDARRPAAFLVGAGLAVVTCGSLIGLTAFRQKGDDVISGARLITMDLGSSGGGVRREAAAFFGRDDTSFSVTADSSAWMRPAVTTADNPAIIQPLPFTAATAGVRSGRVERVWEAEAPIPTERVLSGNLQFTSAGVKLELENQIGQELQSPVLVWNDTCYRLPDLKQSRTSAMLGPKNPNGDFTNASVFTGEEAGLRGRILQLASSPPRETASGNPTSSPQIAGWLTPSASGICGAILSYSTQPHPDRVQALLRSPLRIIPSPDGETIAVAPEFVTMSGDAGAFYDEAKREWVQSIQTGAWRIGFSAPPQIGVLSPIRATIIADLVAPGHSIILRRGQCTGGKLGDNPEGEIIAEWKQPVGVRTVEVDLAPDDVDASGRLWLRLSVDESGSSGAGVLSQWKFNTLSVGITAKVSER